jgi:hypothetical protein
LELLAFFIQKLALIVKLLAAGSLPTIWAEEWFFPPSKSKWDIRRKPVSSAILGRILLEAGATVIVESAGAVGTLTVAKLIAVVGVAVDLADLVLPSARKVALAALGVSHMIIVRVILFFLKAVLVPETPVFTAPESLSLRSLLLLDSFLSKIGADLAFVNN